ncbi:DUF6318 family protein [Branchiibius cervicis]|uniref:DUF6318 family protein n=1 Tax=Branchiibius cervicis TaxID=908252 RepID=A0ABW2ARG9_9MICO
MSSASSTPTVASTGNPALGINGLPDAAKQKTTDGAIAFVKYYVSVINQAYQHPQTGLLEPFALESCKTCDRWEQSVAQLVRNNQHADAAIFPEVDGTEIVADLLDLQPPRSTCKLHLVLVPSVMSTVQARS